MGLNELQQAINSAVDKRIQQEARAMRGIVKGGMFHSGTKSYPYKQAVDCNIGGNKVWAQLSTNGKAVIVGA